MESLSAQFDDLMRQMQVLADPAEYKFLEFLDHEEKNRVQLRELEAEVSRLNEQATRYQKEIKSLEMKLKNAKHMLDVEKAKRITTEKEKNDLAGQIGLVMELLGRGQVNETRERLQQLQHSFTFSGTATNQRRSTRDLSPGPLSTITEDNDTMGSILSVSDIDITEDDLEESRLRSGRSFKRRSSPERQDSSKGKRRSGRRSEEIQSHEVKTQVTYYTQGDEIKKVHTETKIKPSAPPLSTGDRYIDQYSCDTFSTACLTWNACVSHEETEVSQLKKPTHGQTLNPPSTPHIPQTAYSPHFPNPLTPQKQGTGQLYYTPTHTLVTPILRTHSSVTKMNQRPHAFYTKTIYKTEHCQPCGKRIKFGKIALKCRDCRATCHPECRESVPLPCVPTANTPTAKGQLGTIADYTSRMPPMVPALVVHCTNEVENRGLSEVGIYRVPGAEKDVKELKDQFLRGKGMPNLSQLDIHVVCGALKDFMRSLKEPLVTHLLWRDFTSAAEKSEAQDYLAALYQAISELPQPNRDTLAWVMTHLQRVAECPECKMPASNLAKVFGPTLVGYSVPEPDPATMLTETRQQQMVMEKLLEISTDYWNTFINVTDENVHQGVQQLPTPEGGTLLGGFPSSNTRRRSILTRTPLAARETPKNRYVFRK
ncbi:rac GTPase-activating protein 1-like isoform X1 [Penaeus indicus]|uniref:rac GTPase-activating protein 1-like isoform X1 n=1 Tax=Penaeus indicus TaxID=29960 RepID=UPI00300C0EAA